MRVLIVDDEEDIREVIRDELSLGNYELIEASGGNAALNLIKTGGFDAVISDISMPNGSGIDLLRGARALSADKPAIILVSGYSDVTQDTVFDLGLDCMLSKPFNINEISDALIRVTTPIEVRWAATPPDRTSAPLISREFPESFDNPRQGQNSFALGRGGFRVTASDTRLQPGTPVRFDIRFSQGKLPRIEGTGWVRWSRHGADPAYGIEFESLSAFCLSQALELVRQPPVGTPYIPK